MNSHNEKELHEILEKQRGTFCQISFLYFITEIIGLSLIATMNVILGPAVTAIFVIFLVGSTVVFSLLGYMLYIPVREIDEKVEKTLKDILKQGLPEEGK